MQKRKIQIKIYFTVVMSSVVTVALINSLFKSSQLSDFILRMAEGHSAGHRTLKKNVLRWLCGFLGVV